MRQMRLVLPLAAALLPAGIVQAQTFRQSRAPVTPDPGYSRKEYAADWPHISLGEARRLQGHAGAIFVDGRNRKDWEKSHIPGALSLPTGEFDKRYPQLKSTLRRAAVLVLYCQGSNCAQADYLAGLLSAKGHRNLAVFWGGFPAWNEAKLPVESAPKNAKSRP
jgi:rhodanese-related sulfurtransferase